MKPTLPIHRFKQVYSHDHRIAVLVELAVDSEFTARTDEFQRLALDLAMQIAATNPPDVGALLAQPTIRDPVVSVSERLAELAGDLQERIVITRFVRWGELRKRASSGRDARGPATQSRTKTGPASRPELHARSPAGQAPTVDRGEDRGVVAGRGKDREQARSH